MSLKIGWYKTPVPDGREDKGLPHARIVPQGTVDMAKMCKMISSSSSFSSADVKGILEALNFWMGFFLAEGQIVDLEGLGHFSPTLKSNCIADENGNQKVSAQADSVAFRCAPSLKAQIREAGIELAKRKKEEMPADDIRKKNILTYVKQHISINSSSCMTMNHCNRYMALKDLNELAEVGKLIATGGGRSTLYIRPYIQSEPELSGNK